jgi:hypothetical protein
MLPASPGLGSHGIEISEGPLLALDLQSWPLRGSRLAPSGFGSRISPRVERLEGSETTKRWFPTSGGPCVHGLSSFAVPACAPSSTGVTIRDSSILTSPWLPLRFRSTRAHAVQARVCWQAQSTVDSLFFIDVPTNPGPRSFCARPVLRCLCARLSPFPQLL